MAQQNVLPMQYGMDRRCYYLAASIIEACSRTSGRIYLAPMAAGSNCPTCLWGRVRIRLLYGIATIAACTPLVALMPMEYNRTISGHTPKVADGQLLHPPLQIIH